MSYPKKVIVVITCHGTILVDKQTNEPKLFKLPKNLKVIKMSAVTPGVCNLTISEDVDEFIQKIIDKNNKTEMQEGLKSPKTYTQTLANLYKSIEKETVEDIFKTKTPDSHTKIRETYKHHRNKSYEIITYDKTHPYMINKEYTRNNKIELNESPWDFGIYCLNVEGKPDLITVLKGRSYTDKNVSVNLEQVVNYLKNNGVKEIILLDLSCSNFEYIKDSSKVSNSQTTSSFNDRTERSIRLTMNKKKLNGGTRRIKTYNKKIKKNKNKKSRKNKKC